MARLSPGWSMSVTNNIESEKWCILWDETEIYYITSAAADF